MWANRGRCVVVVAPAVSGIRSVIWTGFRRTSPELTIVKRSCHNSHEVPLSGLPGAPCRAGVHRRACGVAPRGQAERNTDDAGTDAGRKPDPHMQSETTVQRRRPLSVLDDPRSQSSPDEPQDPLICDSVLKKPFQQALSNPAPSHQHHQRQAVQVPHLRFSLACTADSHHCRSSAVNERVEAKEPVGPHHHPAVLLRPVNSGHSQTSTVRYPHRGSIPVTRSITKSRLQVVLCRSGLLLLASILRAPFTCH
jgi:hypothetical protein